MKLTWRKFQKQSKKTLDIVKLPKEIEESLGILSATMKATMELKMVETLDEFQKAINDANRHLCEGILKDIEQRGDQ